ncbi:hypothetical protein PTMSG1_08772 [Pyrenophora teres f. maculata]|nr:hypothetical protein PTMSG1_08772 [Pyrenophora teres f. maculata]
MRFSTSLPALFLLIGPFVSAKLHKQGLCADNVAEPTPEDPWVDQQWVYNDAATRAMCNSYRNRNTGGEWWDTCPDCQMTVISNLPMCISNDGHMGGDEIEYYCHKHGAEASLA